MLIGIDCSRALGPFWGGPESYSYYLIRAILKANSKHRFRLYLPPNAQNNPRYKSFFSGFDTSNISPSVIPDRDPGSSPSNVIPVQMGIQSLDSSSRAGMTNNYKLKTINWKRLWTQGGLALECFMNPPDVLFVPAHTLPILRRPGLKTVVTIHDLGAEYLPNYHKFPQKYYLNTMTEYAVKNASKIIAVSEYTKKDIINRFHPSGGKILSHPTGESTEKIKVVYEGYDRETFYPRNQQEIDPIKKKLGIDGDYFLFVGTIQPRKNLVRLIEALSLFQKGLSLTRTVLPELVLAGSSGWLDQEIYDAPKKFGVEGKVKFVGKVPQEDLPALISGSRAFVFPSLFEGFGLAPLEAMACGVPVILSNVTSLPEVGGEAVFYVDPNSSNDIAGKMELVLSMSNSDRSVIVKKGLDQACKFSWEQAAVETLVVLEEVSTPTSS